MWYFVGSSKYTLFSRHVNRLAGLLLNQYSCSFFSVAVWGFLYVLCYDISVGFKSELFFPWQGQLYIYLQGISNLTHVARSWLAIISRITVIQSSESHNNTLIIFKRVWKSSRGTNPHFRARERGREREQGQGEGVKIFFTVLFSFWSALFLFLCCQAHPSIHLLITLSILLSIPNPFSIYVKIASYLPALPLSFSH